MAPKLVPKWNPQGSFLGLFSPLWERWCSILLVSVIVDCCLRDFSRFSNGASFLDTLRLHFGHLRPWLSQASRLCRCLALAWGCFPSLFPPCALRSVAGSPGKYPPSTCRVPRIGPAECAKRLKIKQKILTGILLEHRFDVCRLLDPKVGAKMEPQIVQKRSAAPMCRAEAPFGTRFE